MLLVVMCVVFVVLATVLILLIRRYWNGAALAKSTLCCGSREDDSASCYPGCHPNANVLYFLDFAHVLHAVDITEGISTGAALQQAVALAAGVTERVDTLSLAATSGTVMVEIDLDRLIAKDAQRDQRMRRTAVRPLLLHRLVEVDDGSRSAPAVGSGVSSAEPPSLNPFASAASGCNGVNDVNVTLTRQLQQPSSQGALYPTTFTGAQAPSYVAGVFHDPAAPAPLPPVMSVPSPLIFPSYTSHISTTTPVYIMAAHYFICYPANSSPHNAAYSIAPQLVDEATTAQLEAAMCGESGSQTVSLSQGPLAGSTFTVNPRNGTARLRLAGQLSPQELMVVRRKADIIRYCIDSTSSSQWRLFEQPIFLPPGRWCLRAKVSSADERYSDTAAKVFSVGVSML